MSYPDTLEVLARLHQDATFRAAFLADAPAALTTLSLSDEERAALARLDARTVERIGRMADFHRALRAVEHLPWADLRLRPDLRALAARFIAANPPRLLNRQESISFCRFVEAAPPPEPPYLADLARHDRLRISLAWGLGTDGATSITADFDYPVPRILDALLDRGSPGWPAFSVEPTRLVFKKVPALPAVLVRPSAI